MTRRTTRLAALGLVAVSALIALSACTSAPKAPMTLRTEPNTDVFSGGLFLQKNSIAARAAAELTSSGQNQAAADAAAIAQVPVSIWLGDQYSPTEVGKVIEADLKAAEKQGTTASFVLYAIPDRDCGDYSAGGFSTTEYPVWIRAVARALKGKHAVVLVEPDSLAMLTTCSSQASVRIPLIKQAVGELVAAGSAVYLDAGNSHWIDPKTMAKRLKEAGVEQARGFFTNVASYYPVGDEEAYAAKVSKLTGGSHYVIDVSRNGQGWKGTWCNPYGTGLGELPHVTDGSTKLDALLWVKSPGTSDGTCNGGPQAGMWFPRFAGELVKNRVHG